MATELHINDGTAWRKAKQLFVKGAGSWRRAKQVWVHDGTAWRLVFTGFSLTTVGSIYSNHFKDASTGVFFIDFVGPTPYTMTLKHQFTTGGATTDVSLVNSYNASISNLYESEDYAIFSYGTTSNANVAAYSVNKSTGVVTTLYNGPTQIGGSTVILVGSSSNATKAGFLLNAGSFTVRTLYFEDGSSFSINGGTYGGPGTITGITSGGIFFDSEYYCFATVLNGGYTTYAMKVNSAGTWTVLLTVTSYASDGWSFNIDGLPRVASGVNLYVYTGGSLVLATSPFNSYSIVSGNLTWSSGLTTGVLAAADSIVKMRMHGHPGFGIYRRNKLKDQVWAFRSYFDTQQRYRLYLYEYKTLVKTIILDVIANDVNYAAIVTAIATGNVHIDTSDNVYVEDNVNLLGYFITSTFVYTQARLNITSDPFNVGFIGNTLWPQVTFPG